jgi:ABC-type glycerol-3-phosphate transport system substrate-binding protein
MKTKRRGKMILLFLFILAILILTFAASCDSAKKSDGGGIPQNQNPDKLPLDLPDVKYDGYKFRVLNIEPVQWLCTVVVAEEDSGIEVDSAVYDRNRMVEDRFDINIVEIAVDRNNIFNQADRSIRGGSDDYDLILLGASEAVGLMRNQQLIDYNEILFIDLDRPYWDNDLRRDLSFGGRNYLMAGDFSMMHYSCTNAMYFNKFLISTLGLESPYELINEGKWTFDKFYELASKATDDLNGDGKYDKNDRFGYMSLTFLWSPNFLAAAGQQAVYKDENDIHYFGMDEKFITVYKRMIELMYSGNILYDADLTGRDHRDQDVMFPNNQALFWSELVHWATILRDMDSDFGIILHPKYDENQESYRNYVNSPPVMCVPTTTENLDRTGIILETLCYESVDTVLKAYYEVLLKTKISRDNESEEMLDLMFSHRFYNIAEVFYNADIHAPLNGSSLSKNKNGDIVSWIDKNRGRIDRAIGKNNEEMMN